MNVNPANQIQFLRKKKGLSQEELADKLGVSRQAVSKWESRQSLPDLDNIIAISNFFDVTTDYLLKGTRPIRTALCTVYFSWAAVIGIPAGILAFAANRFRNNEIFLISLAGAAVGLCIGKITSHKKSRLTE